MDIAFVTTRLVDRDAQGNFTAATLEALKSKGAGRVTLFTFAYERPPVDGVEVILMGKGNAHSIRSNLDALRGTGRLAKELGSYDIIVLVGPDLGALPAIHLAKRYNQDIRLFWVFHSMTPPEFLPSWKDRLLTHLRLAGYHMSMRRSDRVQTFSEFVKKELIGAGIPGEKIVSMPFLIDTSGFASGDRDKIRARYACSDRFVLLYVGRLAPAKRVDRLLRAMATMKDEQVTLVVVGSGPEEGRLKAQANNLGIGSIVIFAGRAGDAELPDYYAACDAWVTASDHEGFCVPIVEAMAAGKPVIVPSVAAMPETAGAAGLVYGKGDIADLAGKVILMARDKNEYDSRAASARDLAPRFDLGNGMPRYIGLISSLKE